MFLAAAIAFCLEFNVIIAEWSAQLEQLPIAEILESAGCGVYLSA